MILYLDTSSLVKLYVEESHSETVRKWVEDAEILATCRIAYAEMLSALSKRFKRGDISSREFKILVEIFSKEWDDFAIIDFDEDEAVELARKYRLVELDAIHLSSLKLLGKDHNNITLAFSSFNERLNEAVVKEGYNVLIP